MEKEMMIITDKKKKLLLQFCSSLILDPKELALQAMSTCINSYTDAQQLLQKFTLFCTW